MFSFFAAGAVFCLLYWILINIYTGFNVSGGFIWIIFTIFFAMLAFMMRVYKLHPKKIPLVIIVVLNTLTFTGIFIFMILELLIASAAFIKPEPGLDYIIVLGARVKPDQSLSKSLKYRVDRAVAYLDEYPSTYVVLSGGKGLDEPVSEAQAMAVYMVNKDISPQNLYLEIESKNTRENIIYSEALIKRVIKKNKQENFAYLDNTREEVLFAEDKPKRIGVVTNSYHMLRALALANTGDMGKVYAISAGADPVLYLHFSLRECAALLKDKFMGHF